MWVVSAVFGVLFLAALMAKSRYPRLRCLPLLIVFFIWLVLGFLERDALIHKANIRIDVVFLWPFIFAVTAILIAISVLNFIRLVKRYRKP
jgi:p-aminobenzoyl-glutamate transporter AbgT